MIKGWGASESYTVGQVRTALRSGKLEGRHEVIAYAGLVSEADFLANMPSGPSLPYALARELFTRALPGGSWVAYLKQPISDQEAMSRHWMGS